MRVIVTPLMDLGRPRLAQAAPVDAHLRSYRDDSGRLVYQLYYPDKDGTRELFGQHLISPQAGDIGKRTAVYYGFQRTQGGALVAQAWEVEAIVRR